MKFNKSMALVALAASATLMSCKKDDPTPTTENPTPSVETAEVRIEFEHQWDVAGAAADFALNTAYTHPETGDDLTFTTFKYYVSNIRLKKQDGTWWTQPESYFLVDLSDASSTLLSIPNVPTGTYTEISYVMGVDSTRNVSGAQTGALSTTNNMFWSWNSGYIMLKAEGTSPQAVGNSFAYHLGGFTGANNIVTEKSAVFSAETLNVSTTGTNKVHFMVDPSLLFHTFGSVSNGSIHMPGADAKTMATDLYDLGVEFEHVHN